ncbi:Dipeptidyl aminopeptidase/acylaminoacyl peptidase [Leifsonia sp. 98AMF]|uniref:S9 family peptidase n=1 Tax=unclassified Leifsonia TaxID=2663824 RepID=UPI00087A1D40|nr:MULTISPECIES: S9 family peptidase [unclassified Leifsonia]SDH36125.1 Dipeptidyl aminopeptidase/acylaminoacyl peptidase [Leifsonia sp. 197AMF]SDI99621.1 Dipeptidyl aminopeptidase/acylaminoacyl peptidase [Leifsonia sp. 466MF]SDJ74920.1 Dipeptidyl aminopeptidase/acylaminoacyl peptidase [Leifsonia sp. 157MF]SDO02865.1 Dipeptidyl aminopeptidase/acylaminoacyl peptidase [Leifsonia sp. 509MF]SEN01032.1 Dipeptidyl aminopeptidase/acylaminoacyl peptidase [Leifsonia sp. 467MF]
MKPADLGLLTGVSTPTVHPGGAKAVVSVTRPSLEADATVGQLWSIPLTGHAAPRLLTRGFRDTAPRFSPDGRLLAFLRAEPKKAPQLFVVDAAGGEPVAVTDRTLGVSEFAWSPDARTLAFVSRVPEQGRYGTVEGIDPNGEPARRIDTLKYQANGLGYVTDRRAHVFTVPVPDVWAAPIPDPAPKPDGSTDLAPSVTEPRQLTDGPWDDGAISFSPDGRSIAFISERHASRDLDLRSNVFVVPVDGGEARDLTGSHGSYSVIAAHYAGGGALFFTAQDVGQTGRDFVAKNAALYVIDAAGSAPRRLTDPESVDFTESDIAPRADDSVLLVDRSRGALVLTEVNAGGGSRRLTDDHTVVGGADAAGETIVVSFADARTTGDAAVVEGAGLRRLTDFSAPLRSTGIIEPRELTLTGRDGYPVHGWVLVPEGEGPHPVLLNIHGGPFASYTHALFDEAQVYAAAGYAVVMSNPRGSAGYGQEHGRVIRQRMGTVDLTDVLDFLDGAIAEVPGLDAERVGIMGGSYGGYLTAWTIAHDHRFAASIVERGFLDPDAFVGTSDIGSFFGDEYTGTDPELMRSQSPQAVVDQVRTPTLVLHSSHDLRCPLGQAERYYAALKRRGVETELVIFPGEDHELSRSGRPRHRQERFDIILDWWAQHLPSRSNHR